MTLDQFEVCATLMRSHSVSARDAARLVLTANFTAEQVRRHLQLPDLTDQQISNAVRRFEKAHNKILTAYREMPKGKKRS